MMPRIEDFTSCAHSHYVVSPRVFTYDDCQRFHLLFAYIVPERDHVNSGEQVVVAPDLEQAAIAIMRERGITSLFVRKRFYSGKPASAAMRINAVYDLAP